MVYAEELAARYERYAAVFNDHYGTRHWRGEVAAVRPFMEWIESFWRDDAPPEPITDPDAISLDRGDAIVRWYDAGTSLLGYTADPEGCYQVRAADASPAITPLRFARVS